MALFSGKQLPLQDDRNPFHDLCGGGRITAGQRLPYLTGKGLLLARRPRSGQVIGQRGHSLTFVPSVCHYTTMSSAGLNRLLSRRDRDLDHGSRTAVPKSHRMWAGVPRITEAPPLGSLVG